MFFLYLHISTFIYWRRVLNCLFSTWFYYWCFLGPLCCITFLLRVYLGWWTGGKHLLMIGKFISWAFASTVQFESQCIMKSSPNAWALCALARVYKSCCHVPGTVWGTKIRKNPAVLDDPRNIACLHISIHDIPSDHIYSTICFPWNALIYTSLSDMYIFILIIIIIIIIIYYYYILLLYIIIMYIYIL